MRGVLLDEADLARRAAAAVAHLRSLGLREDDRIAVLGENTPNFVSLRDAATTLGLYFIPLNPRLAPPEIEDILARTRAPLAGDGLNFLTSGVRGAEKVKKLRPSPVGATILFTSGTTGRPKGCVRPEEVEGARAAEIVATYGLNDQDVHLIACPLAHSAPGIFLRAARGVGAATVLLEKFEARAFVAAVAEFRATVCFLVPTQIGRLLALPAAERAAADVSSLRAVIVAGAPFPAAARRGLVAWLGAERVWEFYGSSETGTITVLPPGEADPPEGCVGRPPPGTELRLLDDAGREVAGDAVGEVWVRSPAVMAGYLDEPARDPGAFITVGDLGRRDAAGRLVLVDRKHDVVITGGVNVYPAEVERALAEHPAVAGAVVCGLPDADWGERVAAAVALRPGATATADDVRAFLRERIAAYKIPKQLAFVPLDDLPVGASGKPLRRAARALLQRGQTTGRDPG